MEVLRSDGSWSLGTPEDYEDLGGTYTIRLADGRCKYMVEEEDLRIPRCFLRTPVALEFVFFSGGGRDTTVHLSCIEEGGTEERSCGTIAERSLVEKRSLPGTRWIARRRSDEAPLLDVTVVAHPPLQRHLIVDEPVQLDAPPGDLRPGCRARIEGMLSRPDLNGAECLALWWVDASQRWAAQLLTCAPGGRFERMLVRTRNLVPLEAW